MKSTVSFAVHLPSTLAVLSISTRTDTTKVRAPQKTINNLDRSRSNGWKLGWVAGALRKCICLGEAVAAALQYTAGRTVEPNNMPTTTTFPVGRNVLPTDLLFLSNMALSKITINSNAFILSLFRRQVLLAPR